MSEPKAEASAGQADQNGRINTEKLSETRRTVKGQPGAEALQILRLELEKLLLEHKREIDSVIAAQGREILSAQRNLVIWAAAAILFGGVGIYASVRSGVEGRIAKEFESPEIVEVIKGATIDSVEGLLSDPQGTPIGQYFFDRDKAFRADLATLMCEVNSLALDQFMEECIDGSGNLTSGGRLCTLPDRRDLFEPPLGQIACTPELSGENNE